MLTIILQRNVLNIMHHSVGLPSQIPKADIKKLMMRKSGYRLIALCRSTCQYPQYQSERVLMGKGKYVLKTLLKCRLSFGHKI